MVSNSKASGTDLALRELIAETTNLTKIVTSGTEKLNDAVAQSQNNVNESYRIQQSIAGVASDVQAQVDIAEKHAQDAENFANDAQNRVNDAQGFVGQCQSIARKLDKKLNDTTDLVNDAENHVRAAEQFANEAKAQVELATAQAAEATIQADRAHKAVALCEAEITKGENIVASADAIRIQTQKIHDNTEQLANDALETLDEQTLAIRDEMQALAINIEADQIELANKITADQQQLASTIKADQDQLELNVANHVLPLSVSLIETQTLIAKYHSFN